MGREMVGNGKIDQSKLRELLHYDPDTGIFTWRARAQGRPFGEAGHIDGKLKNRPRRRIVIEGRRYFAHQLAWLYMTGEFPRGSIDHIDVNGLNNRWSNLRLATASQNAANTIKYRTNRSGFKGVCWSKKKKKFKASICVGGKQIVLGFADTAEAVHQLYRAAATRYFGEFARW